MDGITAAVISIGMERQAQQLNANSALVREARRTDASVLQLLDAAKATEGSSGGKQNASQAANGKGTLINVVA